MLALALGLALPGCAAPLIGAGPQAPSFYGVDPDIVAGYAKYRDVLASAGRWKADLAYGARWCPRSDSPVRSFEPYRVEGRWVALGADQAGAYAVPVGTLAWDAPGPEWLQITLHHGYWGVSDERDSNESWCWVPGAEATPARVVWREGRGLAAWAPEPPLGHVASGEEDDLPWRVVLLGALLESPLGGQLLSGDDADQALQALATSAKGAPHDSPRAGRVEAARAELAAYAAASLHVSSPALPLGGALVAAIARTPLRGPERLTPSFSLAGAAPRRSHALAAYVAPAPRSPVSGAGPASGSSSPGNGGGKALAMLILLPFRLARLATR